MQAGRELSEISIWFAASRGRLVAAIFDVVTG
jgi:hypothetical protein